MKNASLSTLSLSFSALKRHFWVSKKADDLAKITHAIELIQEHSSCIDIPYSLEVANILRHFDVDQVTLIATILSDRDLLEILPEEKLIENFGTVITTLVQSVRRLNQFHNCDNNQQVVPAVPKQAEGLRRMLLAITKDARAVLIKLAWRLQHLRALAGQQDTNKRHCTAQETMDIFAPLANRLGISQIKWELEDLSFHYLQPTTYKQIAKALNFKRTQRETYIANFIEIIKQFVKKHNIEAEVYGRPKHIYSIYKKMLKKQLDSIDQLYDLRAIRIIVDSQTNCYRLLAEIHNRWQSIPDEFDDYIAHKKSNGYQSLHTVVFGPKGRTIEIQIRTQDMHTFAELGVAAHWRYKEGGSQNAAMEKAISSLRELLVLDNTDTDTDNELLEDFQAEIFPDRVFALTPKGEVIDLPKGSTALDFAYAVHTQIGHRCRGAKVNGRIIPLTYPLNSGDQVEVLTHKEARPNRNWLNSTFGYMQSSRARNAVRHWFRQQDYAVNKHDGQILLDREIKRLGNIHYKRADLTQHFHKHDYNEFLISLGRGDIGAHQLANVLSPPAQRKQKTTSSHVFKKNKSTTKGGITVDGVDNILANIANCCKPAPNDPIIGYTTLGRGVSVHRTDCPNINPKNLSAEQNARLIPVSWSHAEHQALYSVDIQVSGIDRPGLLRDVTIEIATASANILDIDIQHESNTLMAKIAITMQINDTEQLEMILKKLTQLPSVVDASRSH